MSTFNVLQAFMIWRMIGVDSLNVEDIDEYFRRIGERRVNFVGVIQSHAHEGTGLIAWHTDEDGDYIQNITEVRRVLGVFSLLIYGDFR